MTGGIGIFAGMIGLIVYISVPVAAILLMMWVYRIKQNSDIQVEQNKEIIQLLRESDE